MFNESAEKSLLMVQGDNAQHFVLKEGVAREQAERFYARREAYYEAQGQAYSTNITVGVGLDNLITSGFVHFANRGRWAVLENSDGQKYFLGRRVEKNYVMVQLNLGKMAKNY